MDRPRALSESQIRTRVGETSFSRGRDYFRRGHIRNPSRAGMALRADCDGSSGGPYQLSMTFGGRGIVDAECSCPVGDGGQCKHAAALLLTWLHKPESFAERAGLDETLAGLSAGQLVAIIKSLVEAAPELEEMVLLSRPGEPGAFDPRPHQLLAIRIFDNAHDGWGHEAAIARGLTLLLKPAPKLLAGGNVAAAASAAVGVVRAICERMDLEYEHGDLADPLMDGVDLLGKLLAGAGTPAPIRLAAVDTLLDVFDADQRLGGQDLSDVPVGMLIEHANPAERRHATERLIRKMSGVRDWSRPAYVSLALELGGAEMDGKAYLEFCRQAGCVYELVERLFKLGRVEEALAEAAKLKGDELKKLAGVFDAAGRGEALNDLMFECARQGNREEWFEWLHKRAKAVKDVRAAAAMEERIFRAKPHQHRYLALKKIAEKLPDWKTEIRPRVLGYLRLQGRHHELLDILLKEGDIEPAIDLVSSRPGDLSADWDRVRVAEAAEKTRPDYSLEVYHTQVNAALAGSSRRAYAQACEHLKRIRAVREKQSQTLAWRDLIAELRSKHRNKRALWEEFARAGLTV